MERSANGSVSSSSGRKRPSICRYRRWLRVDARSQEPGDRTDGTELLDGLSLAGVIPMVDLRELVGDCVAEPRLGRDADDQEVLEVSAFGASRYVEAKANTLAIGERLKEPPQPPSQIVEVVGRPADRIDIGPLQRGAPEVRLDLNRFRFVGLSCSPPRHRPSRGDWGAEHRRGGFKPAGKPFGDIGHRHAVTERVVHGSLAVLWCDPISPSARLPRSPALVPAAGAPFAVREVPVGSSPGRRRHRSRSGSPLRAARCGSRC